MKAASRAGHTARFGSEHPYPACAVISFPWSFRSAKTPQPKAMRSFAFGPDSVDSAGYTPYTPAYSACKGAYGRLGAGNRHCKSANNDYKSTYFHYKWANNHYKRSYFHYKWANNHDKRSYFHYTWANNHDKRSYFCYTWANNHDKSTYFCYKSAQDHFRNTHCVSGISVGLSGKPVRKPRVWLFGQAC
jgi:hypothetical protein